MRKHTLHSLTIILGIAMALVIVFSQVFQVQTVTHSKKQEIKTAQQKDASPEQETIISVPSITLPSSVHVQLNLEVYCIFDIFCEDTAEEAEPTDSPLITQQFFRTLFRVIISPNAP